MTSQSGSNNWEFTAALDLLHSYSQALPDGLDGYAALYLPSSSSLSDSDTDSVSGSPKRRPTLGNFKRVFKFLNKPIANHSSEAQVESLDDGSTDSEGDTSHPPTPVYRNDKNIADVKSKGVAWTDDPEDSTTAECLGPAKASLWTPSIGAICDLHAQKSASTVDDNEQQKKNSSHASIPKASSGVINTRSNADDGRVTKHGIPHNSENTINPEPLLDPASARYLLPGWVTPLRSQPAAWKSPVCVEYGELQSMLTLTRMEKKYRIIRRLEVKFGPRFLQHLNYSRGVWRFGGNKSEDGIHVFVDSSNIVIGFYDSLKLSRGLNVRMFTKRAPISFHSLALIMERGRGVARRVLVGSSDRNGENPDYMSDAAECDYEISSLNRVTKFKEERSAVKSGRSGNRYRNPGISSGSDTQLNGQQKIAEQGVDEILHMKMLESIVDAKQPSTIVLATGDAAEAEYSGGFLKNVERALNKGWKVELVAWAHSMSNAYKSKAFLEKWKDQFMIIELDDFSEDLLKSYVEPAYYTTNVRNNEPGMPFVEDLSSE